MLSEPEGDALRYTNGVLYRTSYTEKRDLCLLHRPRTTALHELLWIGDRDPDALLTVSVWMACQRATESDLSHGRVRVRVCVCARARARAREIPSANVSCRRHPYVHAHAPGDI